jgi:hypothetical protein
MPPDKFQGTSRKRLHPPPLLMLWRQVMLLALLLALLLAPVNGQQSCTNQPAGSTLVARINSGEC